MDLLKISLIIATCFIGASLFIYSIGLYSNSLRKSANSNSGFFESCTNGLCGRNQLSVSLALCMIGFVLLVHCVVFLILSIIMRFRMPRMDHLKLLIATLIYNILSIVFMAAGWNELRLQFASTASWSYYMVLIGFSVSILGFVPIIISLVKRFY